MNGIARVSGMQGLSIESSLVTEYASITGTSHAGVKRNFLTDLVAEITHEDLLTWAHKNL